MVTFLLKDRLHMEVPVLICPHVHPLQKVALPRSPCFRILRQRRAMSFFDVSLQVVLESVPSLLKLGQSALRGSELSGARYILQCSLSPTEKVVATQLGSFTAAPLLS